MFEKIKQYIQTNKQELIILVGILVVIGVGFLGLSKTAVETVPTPNGEVLLGEAYADSKWFIVDKFVGFFTKADTTKIPDGANANGQNTLINDGDRISSRNFGYEILGIVTTTEQPIKTLHTFRKRDGENILMRTRGTYIEYYDEDYNNWTDLSATSTSGLAFGFADFNINTDQRSLTYFGNGTDNFMRWNGAHSLATVSITVGTTTITVADASKFFTTGTIRYCGTNAIYTSRTATTFTLSSSTTVTCTSGLPIAQAIEEYPTYPKGNIYLVANNRLFISGETINPQLVYFSAYGNANTWLTTLVSDSTADAAGAFNLAEGGGPVVGMSQDEGSIYIFKKSITYKATLSDSLYTLLPLKPFDGKSQTTGLASSRLVFSGSNAVYFVSPDNQIMSLSRLATVDYPQISPISYPISQTVDTVNFSNGAGIFWKQSAYFAVKSTSDSTFNDSVLVYNAIINAWESPIIGWAVNDFTIYDDGNGEALYFGDANTANVYKVVIGDPDNNLAFTSSWRSKQFDFSELAIPSSQQKEIDNVYVEGYITDNTSLTVSLLLDENGYTQKFSTVINGSTDTGLLYNSSPYNIFGLHPFGYLRFGSSDQANKKKFRVYLSKDFRAYPFYNAQIEFASDSDGQSWEVTEFGFKVRASTMQEKRTLYKSFK